MNSDEEWIVDQREVEDEKNEHLDGSQTKRLRWHGSLLVAVGAILLLMAILVLISYVGVRVTALSGLWVPIPDDAAKVSFGTAFGLVLLIIGIHLLRARRSGESS